MASTYKVPFIREDRLLQCSQSLGYSLQFQSSPNLTLWIWFQGRPPYTHKSPLMPIQRLCGALHFIRQSKAKNCDQLWFCELQTNSKVLHFPRDYCFWSTNSMLILCIGCYSKNLIHLGAMKGDFWKYYGVCGLILDFFHFHRNDLHLGLLENLGVLPH